VTTPLTRFPERRRRIGRTRTDTLSNSMSPASNAGTRIRAVRISSTVSSADGERPVAQLADDLGAPEFALRRSAGVARAGAVGDVLYPAALVRGEKRIVKGRLVGSI
jgi:hypothetical protein